MGTRRINGFEWPWRKRQVLAICVFVLTGLLSGVLLVPMLEGFSRWTFVSIFWLSWVVLFAGAFRTMMIDPVDSNVGCTSASEPIPGKPWCSICEASVRMDSKHCWECNKCVGNFDHHCPWLNTCIGTKNYGTFFVTIWSALTMLSSVLVFSSLLLWNLDDPDALELPYELDEITAMGILIAIVVLHAPLWCLDLSLVMFHCFLCWKDTTTYEYLTGKTKQPPSTSPKTQRATPTATGERPELGSRSISAMSSGLTSAASLRSPVNLDLQKEVSDFIFGSPSPADPAETDTREVQHEKRRGSKESRLDTHPTGKNSTGSTSQEAQSPPGLRAAAAADGSIASREVAGEADSGNCDPQGQPYLTTL